MQMPNFTDPYAFLVIYSKASSSVSTWHLIETVLTSKNSFHVIANYIFSLHTAEDHYGDYDLGIPCLENCF